MCRQTSCTSPLNRASAGALADCSCLRQWFGSPRCDAASTRHRRSAACAWGRMFRQDVVARHCSYEVPNLNPFRGVLRIHQAARPYVKRTEGQRRRAAVERRTWIEASRSAISGNGRHWREWKAASPTTQAPDIIGTASSDRTREPPDPQRVFSNTLILL